MTGLYHVKEVPPCLLGKKCRQQATQDTHWCCNRCRMCKDISLIESFGAGPARARCKACVARDAKRKEDDKKAKEKKEADAAAAKERAAEKRRENKRGRGGGRGGGAGGGLRRSARLSGA